MRRWITLTVLGLVSSTAVADRAMVPATNMATLPAPCRTVTWVPGDARTPTPALAAEISGADCMAMINLHALRLSPTKASVDAVDEAMRPSIAMLDAVIQTGSPDLQIIAQHAKADLFSGAAVRLLSTVPPVTPTTVGQALIEHDQQVADMVELVRPLRDQARMAFREVEQLAPSVAAQTALDPVLAFAISDSKFEEEAAIATK
jgi:hypothetical protein